MSEYRFATQQNISIPYTTTEIAEEIFGIKAYKPSDLLNALHLKINSLGIIVQITRRMPKSELGRIKPSIINFAQFPVGSAGLRQKETLIAIAAVLKPSNYNILQSRLTGGVKFSKELSPLLHSIISRSGAVARATPWNAEKVDFYQNLQALLNYCTWSLDYDHKSVIELISAFGIFTNFFPNFMEQFPLVAKKGNNKRDLQSFMPNLGYFPLRLLIESILNYIKEKGVEADAANRELAIETAILLYKGFRGFSDQFPQHSPSLEDLIT